MIPRYYLVAERTHELQNPISVDKLVLLGERLGLGPGSRVLDIASGRGGPALVLGRTFGCSVEGIEIAPEFHAAAVERAAAEGLADRLSFRLADASSEELARDVYDAALCLGATFVYGGLGPTLDALRPSIRPVGHVVVGEPYWRAWPPPSGYDDRDGPYLSLDDTVTSIESHGLSVVSLIAADDWDRYETLRWHTAEDWLAANEGDADAAEVRAMHESSKQRYLRYRRDALGWAIFACRKTLD